MVWPISRILGWVHQIEAELGTPYNVDDLDGIAERIASLAAQFSSSINAYASAKWYLAAAEAHSYDIVWGKIKAMDPETAREMRGVASSQNVKKYIHDRCADLIWLEAQTERYNKAIAHTIDALRSILSKGKEDRKIAAYSQQVSNRADER